LRDADGKGGFTHGCGTSQHHVSQFWHERQKTRALLENAGHVKLQRL
jgi:hypothetical protein